MSENEMVKELARQRFKPRFTALHRQFDGPLTDVRRKEYKDAYFKMCAWLTRELDRYDSDPVRIRLMEHRRFARKKELAA